MSLNSPAITELSVESAPLNLLAEWLRFYFDGGPHAVGANDPVVFPVVNLAFNQSPAVQPLFKWNDGADTTIRVVMLARNETQEHLDTVLAAGKLATSRVLFQFQITSKQKTDAQAQQAAQTVGNLLKALLTNPDSIADLGEKGLRMLSPEPPRAVQSTDYALRLVFCGGQLLYPIRFGAQPSAPDYTTLPDFLLGSIPATSYQPNALIVGEYLLNDYAWTKAVKLSSAVAVALAPQNAVVVLELEVNGALTGRQLILPLGGVTEEVTSGSVPLNLTVSAGQSVRWQVVSAPSPEDSAWRCSVTLQVLPV